MNLLYSEWAALKGSFSCLLLLVRSKFCIISDVTIRNRRTERLNFASPRIQFALSLCVNVLPFWNGQKSQTIKENLSLWISLGSRNGPDQHLKNSTFTLCFIFLLSSSPFHETVKKKKAFSIFSVLVGVSSIKPGDKKKKTRLFMNQQCVSMWVDKTASSCLVSFSLSYSVGQKVMPTGSKSHWKGPSTPARYCLWIAVVFFLVKENIKRYVTVKLNKNDKRKCSWGPLILVVGTSAATNKCIMMKRWAGSPCSFWCFGKCHTRLGPTCLPGYYGWH